MLSSAYQIMAIGEEGSDANPERSLFRRGSIGQKSQPTSSPRRLLMDFPMDDVDVRKTAQDNRVLDHDSDVQHMSLSDETNLKVRAAMQCYRADACTVSFNNRIYARKNPKPQVRRRYHACTTGNVWSALRPDAERATFAASLQHHEYDTSERLSATTTILFDADERSRTSYASTDSTDDSSHTARVQAPSQQQQKRATIEQTQSDPVLNGVTCDESISQMEAANLAKRQSNREAKLAAMMPLPTASEMIEFKQSSRTPQDNQPDRANVLLNVLSFRLINC